MFLDIDSSKKYNPKDSLIAIILMVLYNLLTYLFVVLFNTKDILTSNFFIINAIVLITLIIIVKIRKQGIASVGMKSSWMHYLIFFLLTIIYFISNHNLENYIIVYLNIVFISVLQELIFRGYALLRLNYWIKKITLSGLYCGILNGLFWFILNFNKSVEVNGVLSLIIYSIVTGIIMQYVFGLIYIKTNNIWNVIIIHCILLYFNIIVI